jgi:hypothetical protein
MRPSTRALGVLAGVLILALGGPLHGQSGDSCLSLPLSGGTLSSPGSISQGDIPPFFVSPSGQLCALLEPDTPASQSAVEQVPGPGRASLFSAILPGMGQRQLGLDRWAAYLAGEAWAWIQYFERSKEGTDLQVRYKDLAWSVARRVSSGPRVDGSFEYYESLTQYNSSGAYDSNATLPGVQPEENSDTYNGSIWELSSQIYFLDDPDNPVEVGSDPYEEALRYYSSRAYTPDLAWNWSSNTLQQAEFAGLIRSSDDNLRRSTTMVGVILANHLLSAVDALVSARLGQAERDDPILSLTLVPGPFYRDSFLLAFSLPIPGR